MIVKREGENMDILLFFQSIRNDILTAIFTTFTICTETMAVTLIAAIMYWCIDKKCGQRLLFAITGSITINSTLKNFFKVKRPIGSKNLESLRTSTATGYSFPSGHTQTSTTVWVSIIEYFRKWWVTLLGIIMVLGAGISRLYLGVHWPTDVLAGWILGIVVSLIFIKLFDCIDQNKSYYILFLILIVFLVASYLFAEEELIKSFGMYTGFILGYLIEDKFINFSTEYSKKRSSMFKSTKDKLKKSTKILRFVFGIVTLGIVYVLLKYLSVTVFHGASGYTLMIVDYFRYTLIALWGVAGVPFLFERFGLN